MIAPYLRLLRAGTLFSPAADVVAGMCLGAGNWSTDIVRAAMASVLVYAAGMVLNDHADRKQDAIHRPERPIPSGQIAPATALSLGLFLMVVGVTLAPVPLYHGAMAALVLLYDYVFKRSMAAGAVTMGVLRALNLLAGTVAVSGALAPGEAAMYAAIAYGTYIIAVTVLGAYEDDPTVSPRAIVAVQTVPPIAVVLALLAVPERWPALAIGGALALLFSLRVRRQGRHWDQSAIRRSMTWLLLGTMVYTALLCLGTGRPIEALVIVAAALVARRIARTIALT